MKPLASAWPWLRAVADLDDIVLFCQKPYPAYHRLDLLLARVGPAGRFEVLSAAWERVLGYSFAELDGRSLYGLIGLPRRSAWRLICILFDETEPCPIAFSLRCKGGGRAPLQWYRRFDAYGERLFVAGDPIRRDGTFPMVSLAHSRIREDPARAARYAHCMLNVGAPAPDFKLPSTPDQTVSLAQFRGQPVVLCFYPADWSPVCGDQLVVYNETLSEFRRHDAAILGVSVDGAWCHLAFAKDRKLRFPLLCDFEPKGAVARAYGVYRAAEGVAERALFVIDAQGTIRWSHLSPVGVNPGADGILAALERLPAAPRAAA